MLDSRSLGFADDVMRLTDGKGVDVVLNSVSGEAMELSLGLMQPFGRFLELGKRDFYGNTAVGPAAVPAQHLLFWCGRRPASVAPSRPWPPALFAEVGGLDEGRLAAPAAAYRAFDASDAAEAFRLMQASGHIGKIVLELGPGAGRTDASHWSLAAAPKLAVQPGTVPTCRHRRRSTGSAWRQPAGLAAQGVRHLALLSRRGGDTDGCAPEALDRRCGGAACRSEAFRCDVADEAVLTRNARCGSAPSMPPIGGRHPRRRGHG